MKILHITDSHLNPLNKVPQSRTDFFHDEIGEKLDELATICEAEKPDFGIHSGDWFNLKRSSLYRPEDMNYYSKKFEATGINWYGIPGNHDLPRSAIAAVDKSAYQSLERQTLNIHCMANRRHSLGRVNPEDPSSKEVMIYGVPFLPLPQTLGYLQQLTDTIKATEASADHGFINVLIIHTDTIPSDVPTFWDTISYAEILGYIPYCDIMCLGHVHMSFPPQVLL